MSPIGQKLRRALGSKYACYRQAATMDNEVGSGRYSSCLTEMRVMRVVVRVSHRESIPGSPFPWSKQ